jgi:hypothetical protein
MEQTKAWGGEIGQPAAAAVVKQVTVRVLM